MITVTTTLIIKHPETSATALPIIQRLTGSVTLFHNCMPTPPVWNHFWSERACNKSISPGRCRNTR